MDEFLIDGTKLAFHPERVAQWLAAGDDWEKVKKVIPLYVEIAPVGACNHRCTFCSVDYIGYKSVMQDKDVLSDRLREMGELGVKSVMFAGEGEPLLYKHMDATVEASKAGGLDVSFTTNGVLLNKLDTLSQCSWVKVSLNAGRQETYAKIHQTKEKDWDVVWKNLTSAAKRKGDCTLGVQSLLLPENRNEMVVLAERCRDAGVDYLVIKPYTQSKYGESRIYEGLAYDGTSKDFGGYTELLDHSLQKLNTATFKVIPRTKAMGHVSKKIPYHKCNSTPMFWAYIMADGEVYSCGAYLLDKRFRLGNIKKQTFREIWGSPEREANWRFVTKELDISECRKSCRMNQSNIYLNGFSTTKHINFI